MKVKLPCRICGKPVPVIYTLPTGEELCKPCARAIAKEKNKTRDSKGSYVQDREYHGYRYPIDV